MSEADKHFAALVALIIVQVCIALINHYHIGDLIEQLEKRLFGRPTPPTDPPSGNGQKPTDPPPA